jgi:hypothetical protein
LFPLALETLLLATIALEGLWIIAILSRMSAKPEPIEEKETQKESEEED